MNANLVQLHRDRSGKAYDLSFGQHAIELGKTVAAGRHKANPAQVPFVIFGQGRCGSTLLQTLLDSHPEVTCRGELLCKRHLLPFARLERFKRMTPALNRAFGFHLKPWHVTRVLRRELVEFVRRLDERGYRFIHLQRANWFLQCLSQVKLHTHAVVHAHSDEQVPQRSQPVDSEMLMVLLQEKQLCADEESRALSTLSRMALSVVYENDLSDPERQQTTASRIFSSLEIPDIEVNTSLRKISPGDWRDGVSNVEDVEHAVRSAGFGHFLAEA